MNKADFMKDGNEKNIFEGRYKPMNQGKTKLSQEEIKHNEDIELLKDYLNQYICAKRRKDQLEKRLRNICEEMRMPIGGHGYSPVNRPRNQISDGAASFTIRKSEEETRIEMQKEEVTKNLLKIMDVFDYLDKNSDERNALELHYIDNYKWDRVAFEMHSSRSSVFKYARQGLEKLIAFEQIQKLLKNYRDERVKRQGRMK